MTIRTTTRTITLTRPFSVPDVDGVQPPGAYEVQIDEEVLDNLTFLAWRRVATTIHLKIGGATQVVPIDPFALEAILLGDADRMNPYPVEGR